MSCTALSEHSLDLYHKFCSHFTHLVTIRLVLTHEYLNKLVSHESILLVLKF